MRAHHCAKLRVNLNLTKNDCLKHQFWCETIAVFQTITLRKYFGWKANKYNRWELSNSLKKYYLKRSTNWLFNLLFFCVRVSVMTNDTRDTFFFIFFLEQVFWLKHFKIFTYHIAVSRSPSMTPITINMMILRPRSVYSFTSCGHKLPTAV